VSTGDLPASAGAFREKNIRKLLARGLYVLVKLINSRQCSETLALGRGEPPLMAPYTLSAAGSLANAQPA
jgi:hypothetical protein